MSKPLANKVALVAGATRGAGRGIAHMLGEAGAIVYCSGRSSRTQPNTTNHHYAGRPETIEETAELVTRAGGTGIPVRTDHLVEAEVAALMSRIEKEQGRLDILVNVLTGSPVTEWSSFLDLNLEAGRAYYDGWIWSHITTSWHAAKLMSRKKSGLIVEIVEQETIGYHGQFYLDQIEIGMKRLSHALAHELKPAGITSVSVAPGFMRTEAILEQFGVKEDNWRDALEKPEPKQFGWGGSETPCYVGRGIAALAADPNIMSKSGGLYSIRQLAEEYGFNDVNGLRPDIGVLDDAIKAFMSGRPAGPEFEWKLAKLSGK
jgi:NAD(P)-dependent dehydrogenase (short-subunit alcohol dehydrogenase family)